MTTAKLSGDKLQRRSLLKLLSEYSYNYNHILRALDDYTTDQELKKQVIRQLDGAFTIIRKAHKKSIDLTENWTSKDFDDFDNANNS